MVVVASWSQTDDVKSSTQATAVVSVHHDAEPVQGDYFPHVQAMSATIIVNVESFNNQFTDNQHTIYNIFW
jgi:hypothetical protein